MPRKDAKNINFQPNDEERDILREYCKQEGRTQSDVLREFIRSLKKKLKTRQDG